MKDGRKRETEKAKKESRKAGERKNKKGKEKSRTTYQTWFSSYKKIGPAGGSIKKTGAKAPVFYSFAPTHSMSLSVSGSLT